jgi:hypothetical protein
MDKDRRGPFAEFNVPESSFIAPISDSDAVVL